MIGALTGTIFSAANPIILMVGGVGYRVSVPGSLTKKYTTGNTLTIFTHTHVRDDALELFGFLTIQELTLFELLITVSGVGPKTALAIIDRGVVPVQKAVASADVGFFTTVPRVGTKNAQKIIIELKNKLGSVMELDLGRQAGGETKVVIDALTSMGFEKRESIDVIKELDENDTTIERKIKHALQLLGKPRK